MPGFITEGRDGTSLKEAALNMEGEGYCDKFDDPVYSLPNKCHKPPVPNRCPVTAGETIYGTPTMSSTNSSMLIFLFHLLRWLVNGTRVFKKARFTRVIKLMFLSRFYTICVLCISRVLLSLIT